ncbi:hypothetical protein Bbelb_446110 [Branchiostoma belcheri]|nr:hypothetical protein Bbelb_446110 [Branchiostoma belcheri]
MRQKTIQDAPQFMKAAHMTSKGTTTQHLGRRVVHHLVTPIRKLGVLNNLRHWWMIPGGLYPGCWLLGQAASLRAHGVRSFRRRPHKSIHRFKRYINNDTRESGPTPPLTGVSPGRQPKINCPISYSEECWARNDKIFMASSTAWSKIHGINMTGQQ